MAVSVVIPGYNCAQYLEKSLKSLAASTLAPFEVIVVDDGSGDETPIVAERFGARVLRVGVRGGPAKARNLGARSASGDILFFIDADVCVYPDTIGRIEAAFEAEPGLDALIGSYDDSPEDQDFVSQYKNLMHCFVHRNGRREASTFWSGCGAIRREVFLECSGFDETYSRPAVEDIELGYRLKAKGKSIILLPELQVKHLKRWTLRSVVKTDILDRGIPWTELILRDQNLPDDLNLQLSQRVSIALVYLTLGLATLCAVYWKGYFLTPLFAIVFFLLGRYWVDPGRKRSRAATLTMSITMAAIVVLAWAHHMLLLVPFVLLSYVGMFIVHRYQARQNRQWLASLVFLVQLCAMTGFLVTYLPSHPLVGMVFALLAIVLILNNRFYLFLAEKQGRMFALAALPFHMLYHFYNGISFAIGLARHSFRNASPAPETAEAQAGERNS